MTRDDVPSRSADKKRVPEVSSRHRFRADDSDDEVEEIAPVSSRQRKDMDDQGALNPSDLPCMYLSVHVGRRAGRSEHGGMTYGSHWSLAKGLKHVAENPSSLGSKNLPQLLERAKDTGDLTELDKFVQKTSDSFMTDTTDPFSGDWGLPPAAPVDTRQDCLSYLPCRCLVFLLVLGGASRAWDP